VRGVLLQYQLMRVLQDVFTSSAAGALRQAS
jgi:hypothetical protein